MPLGGRNGTGQGVDESTLTPEQLKLAQEILDKQKKRRPFYSRVKLLKARIGLQLPKVPGTAVHGGKRQ
jgi:hypothetical protein